MKHCSTPIAAIATLLLVCSSLNAISLVDFKCENSAHKVDLVISSDLVASPKALVLPVYDSKPEEHVTSVVFVSPDGRVAGTIGGKDSQKKALSNSLKLSEFDGAAIFGTPAWCSLNFTSEDCFYEEEAADPKANFVPPVAAFRFDYLGLVEMKLSAPATETDDKPMLLFEFSVDKNGKTTSIKALNERDEGILNKQLLPKMASFVFQPATLNGQPVATKLVLSIDGVWAKPEGESTVPPFCAEAISQPQANLAVPYAGDPLKITCYMTFTQDGSVETVRVSGSVSAGLAISILNKVRTWKNPVQFDWDCKMPIGIVEFDCTPGSKDVKLNGAARPIIFVAPKMLEQADFMSNGMVIDSFPWASYRYTIDKDGNLKDMTIVKSSDDKFAERMGNTIKKGTYSPAKIEGENVESSIEELCSLKIMQYWVNTDSLKW